MSYTNGLDKPTDYFNTILYTGDGNTRSLTGVGFQPDLVWAKERNGTNSHNLWDIVRGATKGIFSDQTTAELTNAGSGYLTSFDSDGFSVQAGAGSIDNLNRSSGTYVAWNWLASNTTASNTDGTITSTVSANTTAGFSVGTYSGNSTTGATVGHGLGSAPSMVIVKKTNATGDWYIYHARIGATAFIKLNETGTSATNTLWNDTAPTSSVFSMDSNSAVNGSGDSYVFYAFAEKKAFSKAFTYTGNGSSDGSYIHLGFKPAFIICRDPNNLESWFLFDNKRPGFNVNKNLLNANNSDTEVTSGANQIDLLANGFKTRATNNGMNRSGGTFIGFAFAENPFVTSTGIPCTAR